jgi:hypothetical protein
MPIIRINPPNADDLRAAVERAVLAVELVARTLGKIAWGALVGPETKDAERRVHSAEANIVMKDFLIAMERHVEAAIRTAAVELQAGALDPLAHAVALHSRIRREAEAAFDDKIPSDTWVRGLERRVRKRWELSRFLTGFGKSGAELFGKLQLPTPQAEKDKNAV